MVIWYFCSPPPKIKIILSKSFSYYYRRQWGSRYRYREREIESDLFWTRVWCMLGFGAENKSALLKHFLLLSAVLRVRGRFQKPAPNPGYAPNSGWNVSLWERERSRDREGANREKLTVKKLIDNEMFFFTVNVPYKPWKIGVNREKIGTKPWKNRHQKSTIFSPLVFHRLRLLEERAVPMLACQDYDWREEAGWRGGHAGRGAAERRLVEHMMSPPQNEP